MPSFIDHSSQTFSHHTYPFICTTDYDNTNSATANATMDQRTAMNTEQNLADHRSSEFPSFVHHSLNDECRLSLEKVKETRQNNDLLTNYDSDDGWSNDSIELLYVDDRFATQKKKINSSLHSISKQHFRLQTHQENELLE